VLADTITASCKIINARYSKHYEPADFTTWNAWEIAQLSPNEFFRALDEAWLEWQCIPPTEERLGEKVERLVSICNVDIVTGRSPHTVAPAKSWLKHHGISFSSFVRTNSGMDKLNLSYEVYIDDSPELMSALARKTGKSGIMYTQPWNREISTRPGIYRVQSWNEIPKKVLNILRQKRLV
jgi:hypothetical protein